MRFFKLMRVISLLGRSRGRREFYVGVLLNRRGMHFVHLRLRLLLLNLRLRLSLLLGRLWRPELGLRRLLLLLLPQLWMLLLLYLRLGLLLLRCLRRPELGLRRLLLLLLLQLWMLLLLNLRLGLLLLRRLRRPELGLRCLLLLLLPRLHLLLRLLSRRDSRPVASHLLRVVIERCARRSGRHLGDDLPLHYRSRRPGRCDRPCADDASLHRRHGKVALHFRGSNLLLVDANSGGGHGTRVHERVMRNRSDRTHIVLVHILDVGDVHVVVDVCDVDDVHRSIRDVYPLHVALARAVRRDVHFSRTEREPCDASPSTTEGHRHAEARSADEDYECRRVHGPHHYRTRNPAPASADFSPPPVVKRSKAPGFILHPSPSPGRDPDPMTVTVWRPPCGDARGKPHVTVIGNISPLAVVIEIVVADDVTRDVAGRLRMFFTIVAGTAPAVKFVKTPDSPPS